MKKTTTPGRRLAIGGFIILALAGLVIGGWNYIKYRFIKHKVSNLVYSHSNGLYSVEYDSLQVDEAAGHLSVTHLRLIPDTARYRALYNEHASVPGLLAGLYIPRLVISGVKTPRAVLNKEVVGARITVSNAVIVLYHARPARDGAKDTARALSLQETCLQWLNKLRRIQADTLEVNNAALSVVDFINNEEELKGASVSLHLYDILIDSSSVADSSRLLFARRAEAAVGRLSLTDRRQLYHFQADSVRFRSTERAATIHGFRIVPQLGEDAMMRASGKQTDRFDLRCSRLHFARLRLPLLMRGAIMADSLLIGSSEIRIYRDLGYPRSDKSMVGRFPHQNLMKLGLPYAVGTVRADNTFIEYKEKNPRSDSSGRVQFYHSVVTIRHLTNMDSLLEKDNTCTVDFNTRFLNMATLRAQLALKLKDSSGRFTVQGSLQGFDAPAVNVLLRPMALAQADEGRIRQLAFSLEGNNYGSHGKLLLLYNDLKVSVLKKDRQEKRLKEKKLVSLIANMMVKNDNPGKKDNAPREATIDFQRVVNKSFFNLIWKSVLQGVKKTIGVEK